MMKILPNEIKLTSGPNPSSTDGLTVLEAVALFAGENHSDCPDCVCPVLAEFARILGAATPDYVRSQLLVPLVPVLVDTRDRKSEGTDALIATEIERQRARLLVLWAINSLAPQVLSSAGLYTHVSVFASARLPGMPTELASAYAEAKEAQRPGEELQFIAALTNASEAICYGQAQRASYCVANAVVRAAKSIWQVSLAESVDGLAAPVTASRAALAKALHVWVRAAETCRIAALVRGPPALWAAADEPIESQNGLEWPDGMPRFARKWAAWQRNRVVARKRGRKLFSVIGEPRPESGQGRLDFQRAHLTWFVRIFPKVLR